MFLLVQSKGRAGFLGSWLFKKNNTKYLKWDKIQRLRRGSSIEKPWSWNFVCGTSASGFKGLLKQDWRKWMRCLPSQVNIIFRKGKVDSYQSSSNTSVCYRRGWSQVLAPGRWWFWLMLCCSKDNLLEIRKALPHQHWHHNRPSEGGWLKSQAPDGPPEERSPDSHHTESGLSR